MNLKNIITTAAIAGALTMGANTASALTGAQTDFNAHYTVQDTNCTTCHAGSAAPKTHTAFGNDWLASGGTKNAGPTTAAGWDALDAKYLATYGPVKASWTAPVAPAPSSSGGGCIASSATTPLMMVLAMLSLGFFVRRKKD
jgi:hypothetical protein